MGWNKNPDSPCRVPRRLSAASWMQSRRGYRTQLQPIETNLQESQLDERTSRQAVEAWTVRVSFTGEFHWCACMIRQAGYDGVMMPQQWDVR